ncbi:unnamed protein product, partial [Arabidopsis halleri]
MMMRNMFAKYFVRGTRDFSTISTSSSSSSVMKRAWDGLKPSWLVLAFGGGFGGHVFINFQKRKTRWYNAKKSYDDYLKREEEYARLRTLFPFFGSSSNKCTFLSSSPPLSRVLEHPGKQDQAVVVFADGISVVLVRWCGDGDEFLRCLAEAISAVFRRRLSSSLFRRSSLDFIFAQGRQSGSMRGFVFGDGFGCLDLLAGLVLVAVGFAGGPRSLRWLACRFPLAKWRSGFQRSVVLGQASFAFSMESPQPRIVPEVLLDARCFCFRCCYPFAWRGCVLWIDGRPRWLVVRLVLSS